MRGMHSETHHFTLTRPGGCVPRKLSRSGILPPFIVSSGRDTVRTVGCRSEIRFFARSIVHCFSLGH